MSELPNGNYYREPNPKRAVVRLMDALAGLLILSGLLVWVWSADWRWAASGIILAAVIWTLVTRSDIAKARK